MQKKMKIGLYGIGLDTYWGQFKGLFDRLTGYQNNIARRMESLGVEVVNAGIIDNPQKARETGAGSGRKTLAIFLYISTYALPTQPPVVQKVGVPVIVLNLSLYLQ